MRIVALDASADDARTERALAVALSKAPERLFLFRAAAATAARVVARDLERRDERFLDLAASWVLDGALGDVPRRDTLTVPLLEIALALGVKDAGPLPCAERAVELFGDKLCMAAADAGDVAPEELENAALWISGGETQFRFEDQRGRATVVPGDVTAVDGALTVIDATPAGIKLARVDVEGRVTEARSTSVTGIVTRMQVRG